MKTRDSVALGQKHQRTLPWNHANPSQITVVVGERVILQRKVFPLLRNRFAYSSLE
jgi:hypothetical protein